MSTGISILTNYQNRPGDTPPVPTRWPQASNVPLAHDAPTLVMFIHPRCPCSRSSILELDRLLTHCQGKVELRAVFLLPREFTSGWERTDVWHHAAAIPGMTMITDVGGVETRRFRASVSGQTLVYDCDGRLRFNGGITPGRGHSGDNLGSSTLLTVLAWRNTAVASVPAFGCPLIEPRSNSIEGIVQWRE